MSTLSQPLSATIADTWRALGRPRRALPILLVSVPMVAAQWQWGGGLRGVFVGAAMCLSFALVAPVAWRRAFPLGERPPLPLLRALVYGAVGVAAIALTGEALPRAIGLPYSFLTEETSLVILVAMFWVGGWGLGRDIDLERRLEAEEARGRLLERDMEQARLLALRNHLDPHFLFNTLNAIAEWCREDPVVAERAIVRLAGLLRTMLGGLTSDRWPLAEELSLSDDVLALYAVRDPERFRSIRTGAVPDIVVPPLLLLPVVENALTHGPAAGHEGEVRIDLQIGDGLVCIEVSNPGTFTGPRPGGHGLQTVQRRLELAYEGAAHFEIDQVPGPRTRVRITLPLTPAPTPESS